MLRRARATPPALLSAAIVLAATAGACTPLRTVAPSEVRGVMAREVELSRAFSLVVAVVRGEELVVAEAIGPADLATGRPATLETVYMLFSISKLFTATAVMQLVDQGLVDLDEPIRRYLPELAIDNPFGRPVTVRSLLSHSSGLPNPLPFAWARPHYDPRPPLSEHARAVLARHGRLTFEPGTRHRYTNVGYLVLGLLVERVGGRTFERYVTEEILDPLGAVRTGFVYDSDRIDGVATGYVRTGSLLHQIARARSDRRLFGPPVGMWASTRPFLIDGSAYGGMVGTAPEVARFLSMHLQGGVYRGRRILSAESVAAMQEPQTTPAGEALEYALGWHLGTVSGVRYCNHMGTGGGFRPAVRIYPDLGQGTVVLTNRTRYNPRRVTHLIVDPAEEPR